MATKLDASPYGSASKKDLSSTSKQKNKHKKQVKFDESLESSIYDNYEEENEAPQVQNLKKGKSTKR